MQRYEKSLKAVTVFLLLFRHLALCESFSEAIKMASDGKEGKRERKGG